MYRNALRNRDRKRSRERIVFHGLHPSAARNSISKMESPGCTMVRLSNKGSVRKSFRPSSQVNASEKTPSTDFGLGR